MFHYTLLSQAGEMGQLLSTTTLAQSSYEPVSLVHGLITHRNCDPDAVHAP